MNGGDLAILSVVHGERRVIRRNVSKVTVIMGKAPMVTEDWLLVAVVMALLPLVDQVEQQQLLLLRLNNSITITMHSTTSIHRLCSSGRTTGSNNKEALVSLAPRLRMATADLKYDSYTHKGCM
ncbi:hypothetical protein ANCCAN_07663 [Ancylostoma caninum]|uniref:Uncharacterized protein n=1 Tax=Ancylostoma caninum TaxID=29170 RepID=A0A368GRW7_ANCCA|nr:hypothetical protein ANCCAN_07663 [Ancylostoma caninum]